MKSRPHTLIRNVLYNLLASLWFVGLHFFTTPYIVHKLGVELYGIFTIVILIIGYFQFLELGLGRAIIKYISEYYAKQDFDMIKKIIGSSVVVYFLMGICGAVLITLFTEFFVNKLFKIPVDLINIAKFTFYMSALSFLTNMVRNVFSSVPRALQRFDITNKIDVIIGTCQTILTVFLLYLDYSLREIIVLNVFINFLSVIIYTVITKKLLPQVNLKFKFCKSTFKNLINFGAFVTINNILITFAARINAFFIGLFMPISYVTYYSVPESVVAKVNFIPNSITQALFPSFSELNSIGRHDVLKELFIRSTKYITILTAPFVILFVAFSRKFIFFWLGQEFMLNSVWVLQLLGCSYLLTFLGYTSVVGAQGLNRPDLPAKIQVLFAVSNVLLCLILIPQYGILGAAIAWTISRFILMPVFIYEVSYRLFKIKLSRLWNESFRKPMVILLILLFFAFFLKSLITSLLLLILFFSILCVLYFIACYFKVLDDYDRNLIFQYIKIKNAS